MVEPPSYIPLQTPSVGLTIEEAEVYNSLSRFSKFRTKSSCVLQNIVKQIPFGQKRGPEFLEAVLNELTAYRVFVFSDNPVCEHVSVLFAAGIMGVSHDYRHLRKRDVVCLFVHTGDVAMLGAMIKYLKGHTRILVISLCESRFVFENVNWLLEIRSPEMLQARDESSDIPYTSFWFGSYGVFVPSSSIPQNVTETLVSRGFSVSHGGGSIVSSEVRKKDSRRSLDDWFEMASSNPLPVGSPVLARWETLGYEPSPDEVLKQEICGVYSIHSSMYFSEYIGMIGLNGPRCPLLRYREHYQNANKIVMLQASNKKPKGRRARKGRRNLYTAMAGRFRPPWGMKVLAICESPEAAAAAEAKAIRDLRPRLNIVHPFKVRLKKMLLVDSLDKETVTPKVALNVLSSKETSIGEKRTFIASHRKLFSEMGITAPINSFFFPLPEVWGLPKSSLSAILASYREFLLPNWSRSGTHKICTDLLVAAAIPTTYFGVRLGYLVVSERIELDNLSLASCRFGGHL